MGVLTPKKHNLGKQRAEKPKRFLKSKPPEKSLLRDSQRPHSLLGERIRLKGRTPTKGGKKRGQAQKFVIFSREGW